MKDSILLVKRVVSLRFLRLFDPTVNLSKVSISMTITITMMKSRVSMSKTISMSISKRISSVTKSIHTMTISTIECFSISLWFSLSRSLAIVSIPGISMAISMMKGRVSMSYTMAISKRVSTVSKTISMSIQSMMSISTVQSSSICFWFSISLTLCNMNSTSRVGNISTCTSIGTMNCWYCSWGYSVDTNSVGNIGDTITNSVVDRSNMVDRSNISSMVNRSNMVNRRNMSYTISTMSSITKMTYTIAKMSSIAISTIESISISFSSSKCCRTQQDNIPDHDDPLLLQKILPPC